MIKLYESQKEKNREVFSNFQDKHLPQEIDKTTRLSNPTSFHQQCNIIHLFITEILKHCKLGNILSYTILFLLPNWNSITQNSNATTKMSDHADPKSINKNTHTHTLRQTVLKSLLIFRLLLFIHNLNSHNILLQQKGKKKKKKEGFFFFFFVIMIFLESLQKTSFSQNGISQFT